LSENVEVEAAVDAAADQASGHALKRELGLWDLVPMQILLVVGFTWAGLGAEQGKTHVAFWLAAILFMFIPQAAVVGWCAKVWPYEGGVYQWTKYALGPFAGFMSAWNFGLWALFTVSNIGILTATSLAYSLGPRAAWMHDNHALIVGLSVGLFVAILSINLPGFGIGKWVSHFGSAVTVLVTLLLIALLFFHPHASAAHPHVSPQPPFSLAMPALTMFSMNLFTKIAFNALTGLEQVAVFAGETRDAGRTIMRSAWIAAPVTAAIYMLMTGSILTYIPAGKVDLTGPIPQILAAAFGGGNGVAQGMDWGLMLGRLAILVLAVALVAQYAVIVAETSRLPLVTGWDGMIPAWFTRLDPRWKTPTRSIAFIVVAAIGMCLLATMRGTRAQEAYQILVSTGNISYGVYYLMMFAIPLVVGVRFAARAGVWLRIGAVSGFVVTAVAMYFNLRPIVDVQSAWVFAAKVGGAAVVLNLMGVAIYWNGSRGDAKESRV
jgi:amino acid transporter